MSNDGTIIVAHLTISSYHIYLIGHFLPRMNFDGQWHSQWMWCQGQDLEVVPTEHVARAITGGVQGPTLVPLVGYRGGSPLKLSGFSIFECLWIALPFHIILKQMNYFSFCQFYFFPQCHFSAPYRGAQGTCPTCPQAMPLVMVTVKLPQVALL